ncbi:MAG: sigma-70 family RNA polymerase sigma factor [Gemmatales bacterium]
MNRVFPVAASAVVNQPNDRELLRRYLTTRSEEAFAELVRRHEKPVQRACRQVLRSAVDVDDVFQATFLVLLRRAREVRWQPNLRGWLIAVAHRLAVRLAQKQQRAKTSSSTDALLSENNPPDGEVSWREACAALHEELDQLCEAQRLPLLLCYLQGYSRDEAAQFLGCSVGSVKAHLERGRQSLKTRLERRGITLSAGLLTMLAQPGSGEAGSLLGASKLLALLQGNASPRVHSLVMQGGFHLSHSILPYALVACLLVMLGLGIAWLPHAEQPIPLTEASTLAIAPLEADEMRYTGIVVDHQGQPVEGAKLFASGKLDVPLTSSTAVHELAVTRSKGEFECKVKATHTVLWAYQPGRGMGLVELPRENASQPLTLQMKAEQLVQGVFKNEAGQPLANVNVSVAMISLRENNALEDQLEKARQGEWNTPQDFAASFTFPEWINSPFSVKSDADGKFVIRGLPQGAKVHLQYNHPQYASSSRELYLLPGFSDSGTARHKLTATGMNQAFYKAHPNHSVEYGAEIIPLYSGPFLALTLRPGAVLAGTATDSEGKPLSGVRVSLAGGNHLYTRTGADGKYSISGVAKASTYMIRTAGFDCYLPGIASAVHRDVGPIRLDLRLRRGSILKGKVIDARTGQGVKSHVQVRPTPSNPIINKPDVEQLVTATTDDAGNFQLVAHPGDVLVVASPYAISEGKPSPYVPAQILPTHSSLLQSNRLNPTPSRVTFHGQGKTYDLGYAYQLLELPSDTETSTELTLTRGLERPLQLLDPEGRPVTSAIVAGLDRHMYPIAVKGGSANIVGLSREGPARLLLVMDEAHRWGAYTNVAAESGTPLTMKLQPLATLEARLQDDTRQPKSGLRVQVRFHGDDLQQRMEFETWKQDRLQDFFPIATSNEQGHLRLDKLLPDLPMTLRVLSSGESRWSTSLSLNAITLKPGEVKALGDVTVTSAAARPSNAPFNRRETRK